MLATTTAPIFGTLPGCTVFVVPGDEEAARAAFRSLRIRPSNMGRCNVDAFGVTPGDLDRGTPAVLFYVAPEARRKLREAGLIDPERIILSGDN
jgi:hypothetical protein